MREYKCLKKNVFVDGDFKIVPLRDEDKYSIMKWRNEQIYHLRQAKPLTTEDQEYYFGNVVSKLFEADKPTQILFSYLQNNICIGYGGLVHVNWVDKNAEISFIINTELEKDSFTFHWQQYLKLIEQIAFQELSFHKIFTYAFDLRPHLYTTIESVGYKKEAVLKEHCLFEGKFIDVIIHSKINKLLTFRKADKGDLDLFFEWTNEPLTRQNSFNSEPVDYQTHTQWFSQKINDENCQILVFENANSIPVGQVRIEKKEQETIIGVSVDKNFRGEGYSSKMIALATEEFFKNFDVLSIHAYIKKENSASIKAFQKVGYSYKSEIIVGTIDSVILVKNR